MDSPQTAPDGASSSQSQQAMGPPNAFMAMAGHAKMVAMNVLKEVSCQAQQWQSCLQQALCVSEKRAEQIVKQGRWFCWLLLQRKPWVEMVDRNSFSRPTSLAEVGLCCCSV